MLVNILLDAATTTSFIEGWQQIIIAFIGTVGTSVTGFLMFKTKRISEENKANIKESLIKLDEKIQSHEELLAKIGESLARKDEAMNIIAALREVVQNALTYTTDHNLSIYIVNKSEAIISLVVRYLEQGVENLCLTSMDSDIEAAAHNVYINGKTNVGEEFAKMFRDKHDLLMIPVKKDVARLMEDEVNNKTRRFGLIAEKYLQDNLSMTIKEYNKYKTRNRDD